MSCQETARVRSLLAGTLDRAETVGTLDHVRDCEDCRVVMTAESRLHANRIRPEASSRLRLPSDQAAAAEAATDSIEAPQVNPWQTPSDGFRDYGGQKPSWFRRGPIIRMAVLGLIILLLTNGKSFFASQNEDPLSALELQIVAALEQGRPFGDAPHGRLSARPKVMSITLPPGERRFRVLIVKDGTIVHDSEHGPKDKDIYFEEISVRRSAGSLPAREALFPFPSAEDLALEAGAEYFWLIELPNGNQSAPIPLRIE